MKDRIYLFYGILVLGTLLLFGRLFELQIIYGAKNREIAEGNRVRKIINPAPRGIVLDRNGKELVRNVPIYRVKDQGDNRDEYKIVPREEALKIEARGANDPEKFRVDIGRSYIYGPVLAHILGYLGEVNENEIAQGKGKLGDLVGRTGIEEEYNYLLRGVDGGEVYEVNARGETIREIGKTQPFSGKNLRLSIDAQLSEVAFKALEGLPAGRQGRAGAVVVTDAQNGQVLALVSSPSFDPQNITPEVLTDENQPMFDRAISGVYPPGSTFKIVTATAGLEEEKIDANTIYDDKGFIQVGNFIYKNWFYTQYGKNEGSINLVRAIKRSTDTFFYKVGEWVGPDRLSAWAKQFGLGAKTGIDLPGEVAGLVPNPQWKEKTTGERWFLGNTYHFAIGQADLLTTPLQLNMMTSVIANEGKLCRPRILAQNTSDGGRLIPQSERSHDSSEVEECQDLQLKSETIRLIKEGMKEACSTGGTAFPFFNFKPQVACKTGTAEFGPLVAGKRKTHAWLTAFAPAEKPEIVVTVLVESGGEGSYVAAPIAKKVIEEWFKF